MNLLCMLPLLIPALTFAMPSAAELQSYGADEGGSVLFATGFDGALSPEIVALTEKPGYRIRHSVGTNGTSALVSERKNPASYTLGSIVLPKLKPDTDYTFRLKARAEGLTKPAGMTDFGIFCLEYSKGGKWLCGAYPAFTQLDGEWRDYTFTARLPKSATVNGYDKGVITLFLRKGITGKLIIDDLAIRTAGKNYATVMTHPRNLIQWGGDGIFRFQLDKSAPPHLIAWITLKHGGKEFSRIIPPKSDRSFAASFGSLPAGKGEITVRIADPKQKMILGQESFRFQVLPPEAAPFNAALIDDSNRLLVNGKPFLPIGIFINYSGDAALRQIAEAGFNTVLPYSIMTHHQMLLDPDRRTKDFGGNIRTYLDLAQKHKLKVLFSLKSQLASEQPHKTVKSWDGTTDRAEIAAKTVRNFKDHPALLGWYLNDETHRNNVPLVVDMRELVSRIDPWHPTLSLTYEYENLPYYAISGDIFVYDHYPIKHDRKRQSLRSMLPGMKAAAASGAPFWMTPQIFNWAIYRVPAENVEAWRKSYFPTADEIMAMPLLAAIHGTKGYIFYMYGCVVPYADKRTPGSSAKEWPKVAAMAQKLNELAPFLLADADAPRVTVECEPAGEIEARAFSGGNGGVRVLIVGMGAPCKGIVTVERAPALQSQTGRSRALSGNRYEFTANSVSYDILESGK